MNNAAAIVSRMKRLILDPELFVREVVQVSVITRQQREGLEAYRLLITAKLKRMNNERLTPEEESVVGKIGISVESGQGTGKDAFASWVILHFLLCMQYCKILCTAPTQHQLRSVLWSEIHKWLRHSTIGELITWHAERIFVSEGGGAEWFAQARTIQKSADETTQAETLAGLHERFMLYVIDEASGVPDAVFRPVEGSMTQPVNLALCLYNPTKNHGYAYETQRKMRKDWICLQWNAEESEIVTAEHLMRMAEQYGRDSNMYRIRVLGKPPTKTPDALVDWDDLIAATELDLDIDPNGCLGIGADIARMGDDKTVIVARIGQVTTGIHTYSQLDTVQAAAQVRDAVSRSIPSAETPYATAIDTIGVGAGVYDHLVHFYAGTRPIPVNVANKPRNEIKFERLRDELLWHVREEFEARTVRIPAHPELMGQANTIKWKLQPSGKIKIESKQEIKKDGRPSPDHLDAYALALHALKYVTPTEFARSSGRISRFRRRVPWTTM